MENDIEMNAKETKEDNSNKNITSEKLPFNLEPLATPLNASNEPVIINKTKEKNNKNEVHMILNKVIDYNNNKNGKNLIFECPHAFCPFIPSLKYYEFTQSVATKCRLGHQYHLSLAEYYKIIFNKLNTEKYCNICLKKNYSKLKLTPDFYCINCLSYLCKKCEIVHNHNHEVLDLSKVNNYCPIHSTKKFSGFCLKCQKDICIHCLKDHKGGHHSLFKYLELIPSKDKIINYRSQIKNELKNIDLVKNALIGNNMVQNPNERNIFIEFFDKMKLKYYFYDAQLYIFDNIKFNISIIKNVTDLFLISQNFFGEIYSFLKNNLNEYNKVYIMNKILSTVLKYQNLKAHENPNNTCNKNAKVNNKYLSHFEFKHLFSMNKNKNIRFLHLLKCGKFIACVDNDGLYVYDDGTFVEIMHITSETDIIDLCEDDSGLIFLLKKSMIEIIKLNETLKGYSIKNKILFKTIDKVNFICTLSNGTIIVSRTKRDEGNLDIWMKARINININQNNIKDKKINNNILPDVSERRNIINMFNNNRRLEIILRRTRNNINNVNNDNNDANNNGNDNDNDNDNDDNDDNDDNNDNNDNNDNANNNDDDDEDNNDDDNNNGGNNGNENENGNENINNNDNIEENNNNNQINLELNNENNNNNIEENNNTFNDNIILQEIPLIPQYFPNFSSNNNNNTNNNNFNINALSNITINNNNNNNINPQNNNGIDLNIIRDYHPRLRRQNQDNQRPRFVHVIRFIRDQLQGLVNNLEHEEELVMEDPSLISSMGIYGSKDPEITHINKIVKNGHEICSLLDWDDNFFICSEFSVIRKTFKCIRIYSNENYEPWGTNNKIRIKNCSRDKNALIKIDNDIFAVCYDKEKTMYGISLVSFRNREEITKIELPKFNLVKKVQFNNSSYLFVLLDYYKRKGPHQNLIKVLKIVDKELVESSDYFFEPWLGTYVYNEKRNEEKKTENEENNEESDYENEGNNNKENGQIKDKELKFMNAINSFEQNSHYEKKIVSMIKLKNNIFVFLNKSYCINFYKLE